MRLVIGPTCSETDNVLDVLFRLARADRTSDLSYG